MRGERSLKAGGRLRGDGSGLPPGTQGALSDPLAPRLPCPLPLGVPTTHRACHGALTRV